MYANCKLQRVESSTRYLTRVDIIKESIFQIY